MDRAGAVLRVTGCLAFPADVECSRCLKPFPCQRREKIELYYRPGDAPTRPRSKEVELSSDDLGMAWYRGPVVDLWPEVREILVLSSPLQPLCRKDCRGLCPRCGTDLNQGACGCTDENADPRWAKLRELQ